MDNLSPPVLAQTAGYRFLKASCIEELHSADRKLSADFFSENHAIAPLSDSGIAVKKYDIFQCTTTSQQQAFLVA
jgi:hypothetical protein